LLDTFVCVPLLYLSEESSCWTHLYVQPYLLAEWDEMKKLYRGPYIDAFCQVWFHLVQLFQRSRLKYEKLTDERRTDDGRQSDKIS
jgi:hypothetical protein